MFHLLSAIISGILLAITFPSANMEPVAFIALVPLLSAIFSYKGQNRQNTLKSFTLGLITGLVFFGTLLYWVSSIRLYQVPQWLLVIGWLFITIVSALFIGIFAMCVNMLKTKLKTRMFPLLSIYNILAPAIIWTGLEFIRSHFPMDGFPWGILGYSQYQNLILIQIAEWTGVFGVSFLIVLVNTAIAGVINRTKYGWYGIGMTAVILGLCLIWGNIKLQENPTGKPLAIAVVQTNIGIDQSWEWETSCEKISLMLDRLTKKAAKSNPDLIIWTETAILSSPDTSLWAKSKIASISKGLNSYLLIGAPHMTDTYYHNSAFLISNKGRIIDRYDKIHLVPFGEMIPCEALFPVLRKIFPQVGMYSHGKRYTIFNQPAKFCTLICYEGIFGDLNRRFVKNGAEFMVNITNDAWTRTRAAYYQHFSMDVFRSVENRRYFIRAGNTGISAVINPSGRVEHLLDIDREGIINSRIFLMDKNKRLAFYSQFGDVFACFCLIMAIIGMVQMLKKY